MKIDRLMGITIYLLRHGKTSAQRLAEEFEVSSRTIMRDMDTLCQAGIPIQSTCGIEGGYKILDTYILEKQMADGQDYELILTALKGLASAYADKSIQKTIDKIELLSGNGENTLNLDFSVAHENREINEKIKVLEEAVRKKRIVQIQYTNNSNEGKEVQTEPVGVVYKWYNWYLIGYSEKYMDYCMYKLVRMEQLIMTGRQNTQEHSLRKALAQMEHTEGEESAQETIEIKLLGKSHIKAKCKEYLNGKVTKEYENGDFEFCFHVPEKEFFWYGVVLSFGNAAKILEPQSVAERITTTCREILEIYSS